MLCELAQHDDSVFIWQHTFNLQRTDIFGRSQQLNSDMNCGIRIDMVLLGGSGEAWQGDRRGRYG